MEHGAAPEPPASGNADRELSVSRVVHAPAALAFNAWTESLQLEQWFGPPDCETVVQAMDVVPEGRTRLMVRDADGFERTITLIYSELTAAHVLSYLHSDDSDPDDDAASFGVAVQFEEEAPTMTMRFKTAAVRARAATACDAGAGACDTLRRLDRFLQEFLP